MTFTAAQPSDTLYYAVWSMPEDIRKFSCKQTRRLPAARIDIPSNAAKMRAPVAQ
jgi:hypothetical protein